MELHHFSDYGFDPQIDYFEQAARTTKRPPRVRSIDTLHFKLQKPDSSSKKKKKPSPAAASSRRRWWTTALVFLKPRWSGPVNPASISGPIFVTQSLCRPSASSGRSPATINLRELVVDPPHCIAGHSHATPICLVA